MSVRKLAEMAFGAGAAKEEVALSIASGLGGIVLATFCVWQANLALVWWQWILLAVLAFDIVGGVPANSTRAAVLQHHKPARPMGPLLFSLGHVHPFLVWLLLPGFGFYEAALLWLLTCAGVMVVTFSASSMKRPVSLTWVVFAVSILQVLYPGAGWAWFAPAFLVKLVAGHAVPATSDRSAVENRA